METISIYFIILLLVLLFIIHYFFNNTKKKIYIGCLYSTTGNMGNYEGANYKMLLEVINYGLTRNGLENTLEIIPIFKDLESNDELYSIWMEKCIKDYNIKYFFGCWKSSQRKSLIELINKYNVRLFYPLQYEGMECEKNIYYFGPTPNQQIIPALNYYLPKFQKYKDIYIIGNNNTYQRVVNFIITNFLKKNNNVYNVNIKDIIYQNDNDVNYDNIINKILTESNNGAIIINNLNIDNYYNFIEQFNNKFNTSYIYNKNDIVDVEYNISDIDKINLKVTNNIYELYPIINFSFPENNINKEKINDLYGMFSCWNFSNNIIYNDLYQFNNNDIDIINDINFLKNFNNKYGVIGDPQYCTFLSVLFYIQTLKELYLNNINLNDVDFYDKYKLQKIQTLNGIHNMLLNNHITKTIYLLQINKYGEYDINYSIYRLLEADPYQYSNINNNLSIFCDLTNNYYKNNLFLLSN